MTPTLAPTRIGLDIHAKCSRCGRQRWYLTPAGGYACGNETPPTHLERVTMVLTPEQLDYCLQRAVEQERLEEERTALDPTRRQGVGDRRGDMALQVQHAYVGLAGELAVAAAYGIPWRGEPDRFKGTPDVGEWDVRTRTKADYDLPIREGDPDRVVVLVLAHRIPFMELAGWYRAGEARGHPEWVRAIRPAGSGPVPPAWFVPQSALHPMNALFDVAVDSARRDPANTAKAAPKGRAPKKQAAAPMLALLDHAGRAA
jgi:hypothetical protein